MMTRNFNIRKIAYVFLIFALVYLGLGLGFHFKWKSALDACREARLAQGEFVEPAVFGNALGAYSTSPTGQFTPGQTSTISAPRLQRRVLISEAPPTDELQRQTD